MQQRPRPRGNRATAARRWAVTLIATGLSTCAVDALATTAGIALATSGTLDALEHRLLLVFLALTYVAWGAGLRSNLRANWALLTATGTSSNVLSKIAFDATRRLTCSAAAARTAASIGYAVTELVKELPYYVSAFGAVLVTDSVSSHDALVFLAGTNLGAAGYESGVAWLTRLWLRRPVRTRPDRDGPGTGAAGRVR